jgi:hypothetical protein
MKGKPHSKYNADDFIILPSGHRVLRKDFLADSRSNRDPDRVLIDKLPSISGSIAGASSKFLQTVQRHKAVEEARVARMESDTAKVRAQEEFEQQRLERKRQFDEQAAKNREKRQRRKMGKSKDGLDLPVEVVKQIKEHEKAEQAALETRERKSSHPLSSTASITISNQPRIPPVREPIRQSQEPTIRIVDEYL